MNATPKFVAATLLALGLLAVPQPTIADSDGWGAGDAEAMLNSYPPTPNVFERIDQAGLPGLDIRPFEVFGDRPYCVDDWHVVALFGRDAAFTAPEQGIIYTRADLVADFEASDAEFFVDGVAMDVVRTPIKPVADKELLAEFAGNLTANYGPEATLGPVLGEQWGRVLAPTDLSVGDHALRVAATFATQGPTELPRPVGFVFDQSVQFTVSPSDSPECALWLQDLG